MKFETRPARPLDRGEWIADAERFVRVTSPLEDLVSRYPSDWLTNDELVEARALAASVVKAARTALTRAGRADERKVLNAHGREAANERATVEDLRFAWQDILRKADSVGAAQGDAARLAALSAKMRGARDAAAEVELAARIAREVERRNSPEGWAQELARRSRAVAGPTITEITVNADGSSTEGEPRPWRMP